MTYTPETNLMRFALRPAFLLTGLAVLCTATVAASSTGAARQDSNALSDSAAVAQAVNEFHKAISSGDSTAALALLSSDAVILESGAMESRAEYRSHHLAGDIGFAKAVASTDGPVHVTVVGNTAWTHRTSTTQGTFNGRAINSSGAESMVLTKEVSGWRIRSIHWSSRNRRPGGS
jgi:ketosteroid isomerase-like protein